MTHTDWEQASAQQDKDPLLQSAGPEASRPSRASMWQRVVVSVVAVALGYGAFAAFSAFIGAERDEAGQIVEAGVVGVDDLRVGDCFDETPDGELSHVDVVPCSEPHATQVFHMFNLPYEDAAPYPSREELDEHLADQCVPAFATFVGIDYEDSQLDFLYLEPTRKSWTLGDREVVCGVVTMDGSKLEGSARGSRR